MACQCNMQYVCLNGLSVQYAVHMIEWFVSVIYSTYA